MFQKELEDHTERLKVLKFKISSMDEVFYTIERQETSNFVKAIESLIWPIAFEKMEKKIKFMIGENIEKLRDEYCRITDFDLYCADTEDKMEGQKAYQGSINDGISDKFDTAFDKMEKLNQIKVSNEVFEVVLEEYAKVEFTDGLSKRMAFLVSKNTLQDCVVKMDSKFAGIWKCLEDDYYKKM